MVNLLAAFLTVLFAFGPGFLLSFAVFKHTVFSRWDKFFFGFILAFFAVPSLLFAEFLFIGLKLNFMLVIANALLVCAISVAGLYYQKHHFRFPKLSHFTEKAAHAKANWKEFLQQNGIFVILLLVLSSAIYVRFATAYSPTFFEFDPYYYMKITEHLVRNGFVETFSPEVYYPEQLFNRVPPLSHYLTGSWYVLYSNFAGVGAYSKELLINVSQFYPPIAGALLALLAFVLLREEYNEYVGLVGAGIFAFIPQLVKKFGAGVSEQQPLGLLSVLLVFSLYIMAMRKKSNRLSILTGLAAVAIMVSSQQYIWPLMVFTVYIGLQSALDYLSGTLDKHFVKTNVLVVAGAVLGSFLMSSYAGGFRFEIFSINILVLIASLLFSVCLFALQKYKPAETPSERLKLFAGAAVLALLVLFITPLGGIILSLIQGQLSIAFAGSPLGKTIQEEGATSTAFFESSFGILNPPLLLFLSALLASLLAVLVLVERKQKNYAIVFGVTAAVWLLANSQIDSVMTFIAKAIGSKPLIDFVAFIASSDVFVYLLASLAATVLYYYFSENKTRTSLFFLLIFFPVAYIGLNKVKFLVHLALAVSLAFGFVLGETLRSIEHLLNILKVEQKQQALSYALAFILLAGVGVVFTEAQTVPNSMTELGYTRIPSDWVIASELSPSFTAMPASAMGWLYQNTNHYNPVTRALCIQKFGFECRVLSWWDYGHWTTFFGETNSVLDPNNYFHAFDQETARAFVNGNLSDLYYVMKKHQATHVLADSDLIGKWGALVFLSGTCSSNQSAVCPDTPEIDWRQGPSKSQYEALHYYEYLTVSDQNCPSSASAAPLPLLQSSFGSYYCADANYLYLLGPQGLDTTYKRKFVATATPASISNPDASVSYLVPIGRGTLLNINPDLSYFGMNNTVFYSAFTQFFFFEKVPGFKLAFRSPSGTVRIFEFEGEKLLSKSFTKSDNPNSPAPSPSPLPVPSATPVTSTSPSPASNSTASSNASNSSNSTP